MFPCSPIELESNGGLCAVSGRMSGDFAIVGRGWQATHWPSLEGKSVHAVAYEKFAECILTDEAGGAKGCRRSRRIGALEGEEQSVQTGRWAQG